MIRARIDTYPRPLELYQGEDMTLAVIVNDDISAATEINFIIDTVSQISKSLSAGEITAVTATGFTVQLDAADTNSIQSGPYLIQGKATLAGKVNHMKFTPNKIRIMPSAFVDTRTLNDYGA